MKPFPLNNTYINNRKMFYSKNIYLHKKKSFVDCRRRVVEGQTEELRKK